ncbi:18068_t:CDS:2, partial [Acaulospora morrowiae]
IGLASGTEDGAIRMWDLRTGQAHRTLLGHTGPITCLQFDDLHIVSGSIDKSIKIWDLRTGSVIDTFSYDHSVTSLQFDSHKIICSAGSNDIKIYNRTSFQHSNFEGHSRPVQCAKYKDSILSSGGLDHLVKIWAL